MTNSGDNTVMKVNASDGSVINTYSVGKVPAGIVSDGINIWVANNGGSTVTRL